jgi:PilZ domain
MMLPPCQEHRKSQRSFMRRGAELIFDAQEAPAGCVIWDISDGGARLSVAHPFKDLPHTFTLVMFKDASVRRDCEVVWTDTRYVGVKFISEWYVTNPSLQRPASVNATQKLKC